MSPCQPSEELRDQWIEALLQSAYRSETETAAHDNLIAAVLNQIDAESSTTASEELPDSLKRLPDLRAEQHAARQRAWPRWRMVAAAAAIIAILFALPLLTGDTGGQALAAAIQRSIEASKEPVLRHYRVSKTRKLRSGKETTTESDLYVEGAKKFAVRAPALLPGADAWLGCDGEEAWFVPSLGPIRVGDQAGLGNCLSRQEQLSSPILQIETVLARLEKGYTLSEQKDETLTTPSGETIECQHLTGKLNLKDKDWLPTTIDLWFNESSSVAIRVTAKYSSPSARRGLVETRIDFVGEPELPKDWFTAKGHYEGFRRTLRFESDQESDPKTLETSP